MVEISKWSVCGFYQKIPLLSNITIPIVSVSNQFESNKIEPRGIKPTLITSIPSYSGYGNDAE